MRWLLWRRRHLEERLASARADAEKSRSNLEQTRSQVVQPLKDAGDRNHFAELIRDSLVHARHSA